MSTKARWPRARRRRAFLVCLLVAGAGAVLAGVQGQAGAQEPTGLVTEDLTALTPMQLAEALVGSGVEVSNVTYTGANLAGGRFAGGDGIVGFEEGIILSSGDVANVVGPNENGGVTTVNGTAGDPDLTELAGQQTFDAAVLEFDFVPDADRVSFQYVFASDEYNEFVGSINDVFAFFVNEANCATVGDPPVPVSINTINGGNPFGSEPRSNPELFINNDFQDGSAPLDTEMDGLTVVLTCTASVIPNETNHIKLAIADASDHILDSVVFLRGGSFSSQPRSSITLTQETSSRFVGEEHVLTATVTEEGSPVAGIEVTFDVVSGPHADMGGTETTGEDGKATFAYTGTATGTDAIEASFVDAEEQRRTSNRLSVTWSEEPPPPPPSSITLTQDVSSRVVGEEHVVTATVTEEGSPTQGASVTFTVVSGPHAGTEGEATTDENGQATFTYTGTAVGTDTIEASFVDFLEETRTSNSLDVTWLSDEPPPPPPPSEPPPPDFSAPADLVLEITRTPATASVGDTITFTITATNRGPGTATGVRVMGTLSPALSLTGVTMGQASCPATGNVFACLVGTLTNGGSAIVTVTGTVASAGDAAATVSVQGDQTDPNEANNSGSVAVPAPAPPTTPPGPFQPPEQLPPPRLGRSVNVTPVRGIVLANGRRLRESEQIPVGAIVNTRRGEIRLHSFNGTARFRDGLFRIVEPRVRGGFTELRLLGGKFLAGCGHPAVRRTSGAAAVQTHQKKVVRKLWGNGTGRFRTSGRFSAATVRGTIWLTADRCDGTLVQVRQGRIEVLDRVLRKRVLVRAGQSYLARGPAARR